jgi:hypothetical protein
MPFMDSGNVLIWQALKLYLPAGTSLTSCRRSPSEQLAFIRRTAEQYGYVFASPPKVDNSASWQPALEFIRNKGYKVAAPGSSMHQRGLAYDFSGPNLNAILTAVQKAVDQRRIRLVAGSKSNLLIEKRNHCVHVEIDEGVLDFEPFEIA